MNHESYSDAYVKGILDQTKTIAMVGASPKPSRDSHSVMAYLQARGYKVYPVNPHAVGQQILGEKVYASLEELPETVDLVDVFRASDAAGGVCDDAIAHGAKSVWMQLGVRDDAAANRAEAAGLSVIMNRCPKIEIPRLCGNAA